MENQKCPELRFNGFSGDWKRRKLSEIATMYARIGWQNLRTSEFLDRGDYMLITGTDFDDGKINYSTCYYVAKDRYEQDRYIQIRNGSILITKDGTLGKVAYVQGLSMPATLNAGVFNVEIKDTSTVNELYLFQYLKAPFLMNYVDKRATGGTIKHLNQNILVDFPVVMPIQAEQTQIGKFFQNLDKSIALHEKKLTQTQNLKKAMLEKMFPKNGSKQPEIRLKRFSGEWEQRELGEYCDMFNGDRGINYPNADDMVAVGIPFINAGDLQNGKVNLQYASKITRDKYNQLNGAKIQLGDIVYCLRGTLGKNAYIDNFTEGTVASSLVVIRPKNIVGSYLFQILNSDIEYRQRTLCDEGAAQPNLSARNLAGFLIPIPSLEEQKEIGGFFKQLDETIVLQRHQLQTLKNLKQAFLVKMFV